LIRSPHAGDGIRGGHRLPAISVPFHWYFIPPVDK
jgi:hypothetical protein